MLVMGTKGYITRPWCLLEIVHTKRLGTPTVVVDIKNGNFDVDDSLHYIAHLEEIMGKENPDGLALLRDELGWDLSELKVACTEVLTSYKNSPQKLVWNPNASDPIMIACLKDIIDEMALKCNHTLTWKGDVGVAVRRKSTVSKAILKVLSAKPDLGSVLHIICSCDEALNEARIMQTELAVKLGKLVTIDSPDVDMELTAKNASAVAVLLTKDLLLQPTVLIELYNAAKQGQNMVPLCLIGRGYDYAAAANLLNDLKGGLSADKFAELEQRLSMSTADDSDAATVEELQQVVGGTLPRIIAVNWEPEGGKNQLEATVLNVLSRMNDKTPRSKPAAAQPKLATNAATTALRATVKLRKMSSKPSATALRATDVKLQKSRAGGDEDMDVGVNLDATLSLLDKLKAQKQKDKDTGVDVEVPPSTVAVTPLRGGVHVMKPPSL